MNEIIAAVDFSLSSVNSVEHAITIAEKARTSVLMVWVNKHGTSKGLISDKFDEQVKDVELKFEELIEKYKHRLTYGKIEYKIRNGKVYTEIAEEAKERKAMLIVAGTHGSSGFEQFWIGSNANKLIASAPCPVITIRDNIDISRNLERIILPLDHTIETRQKVGIATRIAHYFKATIHILCIYTTNTKMDHYKVEGYGDMVEKHLQEYNIPYERKTVKSDNPTKTTIDYAQEIDANLLVIMTEQVFSTKNLWLGTYAQQMVNQSLIPVLSVRAQSIYDYQTK
ncbi:MAG: universal stress protein [Saprospiraceae bacterium]|nr:universal stress protein [Saprospiraceae bacterium]